jgi:hypothetical protein
MDESLPIDRASESSGDSVDDYALCYPDIVAAMRPMRALDAIAAVAGLLTVPELQANCFRLEVLVHLTVAFCRGHITPAPTEIKSLFDRLDEGICGRMEDPAESVFVSLVNTAQGNFRIFEGLREGTSFYLQCILDVLEAVPNEEPFDRMMRSVHSLLKLSECVAERAGISEHQLGQEVPAAKLDDTIVATLHSISARVRFKLGEVKALGIELYDLMPFVFDPSEDAALRKQHIGNSGLERYPLAFLDEQQLYIVADRYRLRHYAIRH